jgi:hypothetical protein
MDGRESAIPEKKERSKVAEADTVVQRQGPERMEYERSGISGLEDRKRNACESRTWR